ncbi:MAG: ABC transporter permease subunit [Armatimonadetes bacterium]|nr:ABC transporter permease subunit [Armatimonadota bacterium]
MFPIAEMAYWLRSGIEAATGAQVLAAVLGSAGAAVPAALLATATAIPLAVLGVRYASPASRTVERVTYLGYATPSIAFALSIVFFSLRLAPPLYQTLLLLIAAYAAHFLAEAVGPIRAAFYQAPPRLEEAARSLGYGSARAFVTVTIPLLRSGLIASIAVVFLSALKDIPLTLILSPIEYTTLAVRVWSHANEAQFKEAAAHGLTMVALSTLFVAVLLRGERRRAGS